MEHFPADVTGFDILARAALRHVIHFGSNSIALITVTITFASGQLPIAGTRMVNGKISYINRRSSFTIAANIFNR